MAKLSDQNREDSSAVENHDDLERTPTLSSHSMTGGHRRPTSFSNSGPRPLLGAQLPETFLSAEQEREAAINEERSLLEDNNLIPVRSNSQAADPDAIEPNETTSLLGNANRDPEAQVAAIDAKWEQAVLNGEIHTTWQREAKVLGSYAAPLMLTFVLQNSLTLTSIFIVGHLGKIPLGAVSLGAMTANITGYAVFQGLATSLDTLCPQAYGSGKKHLVGLQVQRMVLFLFSITIPIVVVWSFGTPILHAFVPNEPEIADIAGKYLKVLILGVPAYAMFESGKRYVQAQGKFEATLYVLLIIAPLNVFLQWLFVWQLEWGFIGTPIAIVITQNLMALLLVLYIAFIGGLECWPGLTRKALQNWGPMIKLAIPGFLMVMAEYLAFEILTLAAARISATHLAAQTILMSLSVFAYQLPFPLSIAASTRVANLVGASLPEAAKVTARVTFIIGTFLGIFNMVVLACLRQQIPRIYTDDLDVIELAANTMPLNAAFQLFDSLASQCNGLLRGLGKQKMGGYMNLFAYYVVAVPLSIFLAFGLHWDLFGLWTGPATGLLLICILEGAYIYQTDWSVAAEEAAKRNEAG